MSGNRETGGIRDRLKRLAAVALALGIAGCVWVSSLHWVYRPAEDWYVSGRGIPRGARALAENQLATWMDPNARAREVARMRASNAEWDFMARTFLVLSLGNMALRDPAGTDRYLAVMDTVIDETVRLAETKGVHYFLMDYAQEGAFVARNGRSIFEDGEIALMLGARRLIREHNEYAAVMRRLVAGMESQMREGPLLCAESYPNECWMFCNTVALAAMRMSDALDGTSHAAFFAEWLAMARARLTDRGTGLLVSCFTLDGQVLDGPEGSSIWTVSHFLQLVDRDLAASQYRLARRELAATVLGFGFAREWPDSWVGAADIDSGPIVPILRISAGSSGQAILAAASFGDRAYLATLLTSLRYGGFPVQRGGRLRFAAANSVGDAVVLYALVQGPLWELVWRRLAPVDAAARIREGT